MLSPYEIMEHKRQEIRRLYATDMPEHELDELVERSLAHFIACDLSNAMACASIAERQWFADRPEVSRQIWNW